MTWASGTLRDDLEDLLEVLELRDVPLPGVHLGGDGEVAELGEPPADVLDVLVDAEDLLDDQDGRERAPPWRASPGRRGSVPSAVGIFTSPASSPSVSVVIVSAETGWTARANPAARVATVNSRRREFELRQQAEHVVVHRAFSPGAANGLSRSSLMKRRGRTQAPSGPARPPRGPPRAAPRSGPPAEQGLADVELAGEVGEDGGDLGVQGLRVGEPGVGVEQLVLHLPAVERDPQQGRGVEELAGLGEQGGEVGGGVERAEGPPQGLGEDLLQQGGLGLVAPGAAAGVEVADRVEAAVALRSAPAPRGG